MLDLKKIRENPKKFKDLISLKEKDVSLKKIIDLDSQLKSLVSKLNNLQADQNNKSKEIGIMKSKGEKTNDLFSDLKKLSDEIKLLEKEEKKISLSLKEELCFLFENRSIIAFALYLEPFPFMLIIFDFFINFKNI